jgi:hypothetical protein
MDVIATRTSMSISEYRWTTSAHNLGKSYLSSMYRCSRFAVAREGMQSGTYNPPSLAYADRSTSSKDEDESGPPRVLWYLMLYSTYCTGMQSVTVKKSFFDAVIIGSTYSCCHWSWDQWLVSGEEALEA